VNNRSPNYTVMPGFIPGIHVSQPSPRRERGEAVPPRGGWQQYSTSIDPDEAYRLQYQARRDGQFTEEHYWTRYRQGLEERGPRR
jgi:hypothetical protein